LNIPSTHVLVLFYPKLDILAYKYRKRDYNYTKNIAHKKRENA